MFCNGKCGENRCNCSHGFIPDDSGQCVDFNECDVFGQCSQICVNTSGSYNCSCYKGYEMRADGSCKVPSKILSLS